MREQGRPHAVVPPTTPQARSYTSRVLAANVAKTPVRPQRLSRSTLSTARGVRCPELAQVDHVVCIIRVASGPEVGVKVGADGIDRLDPILFTGISGRKHSCYVRRVLSAIDPADGVDLP